MLGYPVEVAMKLAFMITYLAFIHSVLFVFVLRFRSEHIEAVSIPTTGLFHMGAVVTVAATLGILHKYRTLA